jgi:hypothetical protein
MKDLGDTNIQEAQKNLGDITIRGPHDDVSGTISHQSTGDGEIAHRCPTLLLRHNEELHQVMLQV